jgi:hypothetical protein
MGLVAVVLWTAGPGQPYKPLCAETRSGLVQGPCPRVVIGVARVVQAQQGQGQVSVPLVLLAFLVLARAPGTVAAVAAVAAVPAGVLAERAAPRVAT